MKHLISICFWLFSIAILAQNGKEVDLSNHFGKFSGGFYLLDLNTNQATFYNPDQCEKRFSPCSSFKIANSLIGLESGVISDTAFVIAYDKNLHPKTNYLISNEPFKYWFQDLSLNMAFRFSSVWYYQELARRVGQERMKEYVDRLSYGNMDISSGLDNYWLCGSIKISILEQIDFLKRMYLHQLNGFSDKTIDAVKSIMLYESTPNYRLFGKIGSGNCFESNAIGWYVGFVETDSSTKIFAMNIIVNSFDDFKDNFRIELTKNILRDLKAFD